MEKVHLLRYLWKLRLALAGNRKQKKKLLASVEVSIREFASENPGCDYQALVKRFGEPRKIAEQFVAEMEPAELLRGMQIRERVLMLLACTATLLVIMRFCTNLAMYLSFERDVNGYAIVEVIEVCRETISEGDTE